MAHIAWPWCEECLAVMGRMKAAAGYDPSRWQSYIDTTRGTPAHIREQALANAVAFCGADRILFGTDAVLPGDMFIRARRQRRADRVRHDPCWRPSDRETGAVVVRDVKQ